MRIASIPFNEELRLQDLYSHEILDSEKEKDFDDLLEVAAHIYGCPIAAITFIDKQRQWLKSTIGLDDEVQETPRNTAFCSHTILNNDVLIVKDAAQDDRFCTNPMVVGTPGIRFYAGAPIISSAGYRLGTICVVDNEPRELSRQEAQMLQILSRQISKLLELRLKNKLLRKNAEEQLQLEKQLLQKSLKEQEAEKQAISTELHENIAQGLAATKFYLEMAESECGLLKDLVSKAKQNLNSILGQIRNPSQAIRPSLLTEVELKPLLADLLSQVHNKTGMAVDLMYEGEKTIPASIALAVYRIIEEQLQNVEQHASATSIVINVNVFSCIYLSVRDNGTGFNSKTFQRGTGLTKILYYSEASNGKVEINSSVKGGCELTVTLPR